MSIERIIDEMIEQDPALAGSRDSLKQTVQAMRDEQPEVNPDPEFRDHLKVKLTESPPRKHRGAAFGVTVAASAAAAVFALVMVGRSTMFRHIPPENISYVETTDGKTTEGKTAEAELQEPPVPGTTAERDEKQVTSGTPEPRKGLVRSSEATIPAAGLRKSAPMAEMAVRQSAAGMAMDDQFMFEPAPEAEESFGRMDVSGEGYEFIRDNAFLSPLTDPFSTFSADVDTASYSNVRRFLNNGTLPPPDAVRIEELVNYFPYGYPSPADGLPFGSVTGLFAAPWAPDHLLLSIGIKGREVAPENLPPGNLVLLLDVSGSMDEPDKLPLLKRSMALLVERMRPEDRISIVVYAGAAGMVLPPTPGNEKPEILEALDRLNAGGSTAGGEGLELAYRLAEENFRKNGNNRIILATDGDFNVGLSSDSELVRFVEKKREKGIFLSVLGFGTGNYQDGMMEQLADNGNGNFAYIDSLSEARKVLVNEMGATLHTIASDVKFQVEFNPALVESYRLIGYENRVMAARDFDDDTRDAGEIGAGHTVTALYEIVPAGTGGDSAADTVRSPRYLRAAEGNSGELGVLRLRWKKPGSPESDLSEIALPYDHPDGGTATDDQRFAASVAAWGMILRDSPHRGSADIDTIIAGVKGLLGDDPDGYRAEFLTLLYKTRELMK